MSMLLIAYVYRRLRNNGVNNMNAVVKRFCCCITALRFNRRYRRLDDQHSITQIEIIEDRKYSRDDSQDTGNETEAPGDFAHKRAARTRDPIEVETVRRGSQ
eukprot:TRINITY_DN46157_c0_g1_i1.p2 TRINITY_DN46157_c0_g1~~TRINITY_DN46157_c0_g1_i1.p2  ORF type:complete len:102 (-),score=7.56 TRINITY_DN46157_c0_g1_i1:13-318(-)